MRSCNANDKYLEKIPEHKVPDVILVKKVYGDKTVRNRKRRWRLKHMDGIKDDTASQNDEYERFLEDLEEDPDLRQNVNVYKDHSKIDVDGTESESGDEFPRISLADMLDDLAIGEDATGGEGAPMTE